MNSLKRKLSTDVLTSAILNSSGRIQAIIILAVLTEALGVAAYGAFVQLLAIKNILGLISGLSLESAFVNYSQEKDINTTSIYHTIIIPTLLISIVMSLLVASFSTFISVNTLSTNRFESVFFVGSVLIPLSILGKMGRSYFRSQMKIKTSSVLKAFRDFGRIGAVLIVIHIIRMGLTEVVIGVVVVEFVFTITLQMAVLRRIGVAIPELRLLPSLLDYSGWLTLSSIASQLSSRADRLLLGYLIGAPAVGVYSVAYGLGSLLLALIEPIRNTFFPEFSRLVSEDRTEEISNFTVSAINVFLGLAVPGIVGFYFVSDPLISLFISDVNHQQFGKIVPVIGIGILLYGLDQLHGVSLIADKKTRPVSLLRGSASILNIVLNLILIPIAGVFGAAMATAISYGLSCCSIHFLFRRNFGFAYNWQTLTKVLSASIGMGVGLYLFPITNVFLTIGAGVVIYTIFLTILGGINPRLLLATILT